MNSQENFNSNLLEIEVLILDKYAYENVPILNRGTFGAAGMDLRNCEEQSIRLFPNKARWFKTGLAVYIKDPNFVGLIFPRSGKGGDKGLILGNCTGVIDSDYQGELKVSLWNRGEDVLTINPGEAIAQLIIVPLGKPKINIVEEFSKKTLRGDNGFGSTGG